MRYLPWSKAGGVAHQRRNGKNTYRPRSEKLSGQGEGAIRSGEAGREKGQKGKPLGYLPKDDA